MEDGVKWYYIFAAVLIFALGFLAASAPKCINETETTELVVIEDIHYSPSYTILMPVGKLLTPRVVPAEYRVYVSYKDCKYSDTISIQNYISMSYNLS